MTKFVISAVLDENKNLTLQTLPEQNQGENNCTAIQLAIPAAMAANTDFYLEFLCPKRKRYISPKLTATTSTEGKQVFECDIPSCVLQEEGLVQIQLMARNSKDNTIVYKSNYSNKTAFFVHPSVNASQTYAVKDFFSEAQQTLEQTSALQSDVEHSVQKMNDFLQDVDLAINERIDQSIADEQLNFNTALKEEIGERKTADEQLDAKFQQAVAAETEARKTAVNEEATARAEAISAETAARTEAISAETAAREAAIQTEAETRETRITNECNRVADLVTAEIGERVNAVDYEANVRLQKDNALTDSINKHVAKKDNPHNVTKLQIGLGNVQNVKQYSYLNPNLSSAQPKPNGSPTPGVSAAYCRSDHVHPLEPTAVRTTAQNLNDEQKAQARANIGAGTSNFSGSYTDLTDKPNGAALEGVVKYVAQTITEEEKTQARENIGAAAKDGVVLYTEQTLNEYEKARARLNIGASTFNGDYNNLSNKPKPYPKHSVLLVEKQTRYQLSSKAGLTVAVAMLDQRGETLEYQFEVACVTEPVYNTITLPETVCRNVLIVFDNNGLTTIRVMGYTEAAELIVDKTFVYIRDKAEHGVYFSTLSVFSMGGYLRITEYPSREEEVSFA